MGLDRRAGLEDDFCTGTTGITAGDASVFPLQFDSVYSPHCQIIAGPDSLTASAPSLRLRDRIFASTLPIVLSISVFVDCKEVVKTQHGRGHASEAERPLFPIHTLVEYAALNLTDCACEQLMPPTH